MGKLTIYTQIAILVLGLVFIYVDTTDAVRFCGTLGYTCEDDFDCCRRYTCQNVSCQLKNCMMISEETALPTGPSENSEKTASPSGSEYGGRTRLPVGPENFRRTVLPSDVRYIERIALPPGARMTT